MLNLQELVWNLNDDEDKISKREIIKTLIATILLRRNKSKRFWIRIWNNYEQTSRVDLFFEDLKKYRVVLYKIVDRKMKKDQLNQLKEMTTGIIDNEIVVINMRKVPNDIFKMKEYLEELI